MAGFWDELSPAGTALGGRRPSGGLMGPVGPVPDGATVGVVGPLAAALGVVRRLQREAGRCEVIVLTTRAELVCEPGWTLVRNGARLAEAVHRPGTAIVAIDVAEGCPLPGWLGPLVARLRRAGVARIHLAADDEPDDATLIAASEVLGHPLVLDLASAVAPGRLVELLDRSVPVASVRGHALTAELVLAARISCGQRA